MTTSTASVLLLTLGCGIALGWLLREYVGRTVWRRQDELSGRIGTLVDPLRNALDELTEHIDLVEQNRTQSYAGLREQVAGMQRTSELLSERTGQLVAALRSPQTRGRWGEIQLERVVELSGMARYCDFDTQIEIDGRRPDLVVRLSGDRRIVVDAKVPFDAYLDAIQAEQPAERTRHRARHAQALRGHVDQLAAKRYWAAFDRVPEFVVLFLPGDAFLDAALSTDAGLLDHAFGRNVILATPTTLIALLRTIAHGWRQQALSENAATIQRLGRELYERIGVVGRDLDRLGSQLGKSVDAFNRVVVATDDRVLATARELAGLELFESPVSPTRRVTRRPVSGGPDPSTPAEHNTDNSANSRSTTGADDEIR
ncbi:DNA recombination protein RmuC [Skermania piniformis]|uniref:DNA recombination protein RmuC n=1 Tax=Skermania pinensis TaxID=39122 RepID=A0ABX8SBX5_9ACTN|nr:DNA recombination protein RmuC [Skermania piniformis]QXQ14682.1 DNA recombination protein RmuC [Skermania piniformis]